METPATPLRGAGLLQQGVQGWLWPTAAPRSCLLAGGAWGAVASVTPAEGGRMRPVGVIGRGVWGGYQSCPAGTIEGLGILAQDREQVCRTVPPSATGAAVIWAWALGVSRLGRAGDSGGRI